MQVLVTGGAGYIGSVTAAQLIAAGHGVTVFDSLAKGYRAAVPPGAQFIKGDLHDRAGLQTVFSALAMILLPVLMVLPFNPALAAALAAGAFIYVVIYTLWLKPRTALNIVIGGAAGSCAVLSGSAAAGNWANPGALALALLVFLWTPIHFWALALVYREDYARAHVPMLPVQTAARTAAAWGLVHGVGAGITALAIAAVTPSLGLVYCVPAALASLVLIYQGARLVHNPVRRVAWRLFHTSNLFLFVILLAICLDAIIHIPRPI